MEEITYHFDQKQLWLRLLSAFLMIGLSFVVLAYNISNPPSILSSQLFKSFLHPMISVISLIGIFFFSIGFFFFLKMLLFRIPLLVIKEEGIVDNSSAINSGFVPFDSIKKVYTKRFFTDTFICIEINDEQKFLEKVFFLKKWLMFANKKLGFEYVLIQLFPSLSPAEIEEVAEQIRDRQQFYKQKRKILLKED